MGRWCDTINFKRETSFPNSVNPRRCSAPSRGGAGVGIWKRCQMSIANCSERRASDVGWPGKLVIYDCLCGPQPTRAPSPDNEVGAARESCVCDRRKARALLARRTHCQELQFLQLRRSCTSWREPEQGRRRQCESLSRPLSIGRDARSNYHAKRGSQSQFVKAFTHVAGRHSPLLLESLREQAADRLWTRHIAVLTLNPFIKR
jgi:hypothetical protein